MVGATLLAAGCGGDVASAEVTPVTGAPVATTSAPVPVEALGPGERLAPTPGMPADVARALRSDRVVVVAFLLSGAADDRAVADAITRVRRTPAYRDGVRWFVYRVAPGAAFGDLADRLGVTGTPAVAVIGRDRTLVNRWVGLIDDAMLRQAVNDASVTSAPEFMR